MNRSAQVLTFAAAVSAIAILIATFKTPALNAQSNGPNVTIASPLPLPVTGSVSVTSLPPLNIGPLPGPGLPSVYQKTLTRAQWGGTGASNAVLFDNSAFQIPSGKALVLEHVSAIAHTVSETRFVSASLTCNASGQSAEHVLTFTSVGVFSSAIRRLSSAPMRCYATSLSAAFLHTDGSIPLMVGTPAVTLSLSGYLVDAP